ncbi:MAG: flagellar motor switch protein FliM [Nitrospirota bacterium]|nr:flagellar motor switch protein FliM [Nitrospirota bacterium]
MSGVLSQEEVDALLSAVSKGEVDISSGNEPKKVAKKTTEKYDFEQPNRIIRKRLQTLHLINDKYAKLLRASLLNFVRAIVAVKVESTDLMKYFDFIRAVPQSSNLHIFRMEPLPGSALLTVEPEFSFYLIDRLLGGQGPFSMDIREFTPIEQGLMERVARKMLKDFEDSWSKVVPLNIVYERSETDPQFVQILAPTDSVLVISYGVTIQKVAADVIIEKITGTVRICLSNSTLEPIKDKLEHPGLEESTSQANWGPRMEQLLKKTHLDVFSELGGTTITVKDLLDLEPGDVLQLERNIRDPLEVQVEDKWKFTGYPVVYRGNKAVQVAACRTKGDSDNG